MAMPRIVQKHGMIVLDEVGERHGDVLGTAGRAQLRQLPRNNPP